MLGRRGQHYLCAEGGKDLPPFSAGDLADEDAHGKALDRAQCRQGNGRVAAACLDDLGVRIDPPALRCLADHMENGSILD